MKRLLFALIAVTALALLCSCIGCHAATADSSVSESRGGSGTPVLGRLRNAAEEAVGPTAAKVLSCMPPAVQELVPIFLRGAASLVVVGRSARTPPSAVNGPAGDEGLHHTTAKFVYAAGAVVAELVVLKLAYRDTYRNQRRNKMNQFFASATGFTVLVLLTALPNDLVDTSLFCVFFFKLSAPVYAPAVVCGQLLRVYVAALRPALPPLSAAYTALLTWWSDSAADALTPAQVREASAELVLAAIVVGAICFNMAARRDATASLNSSSAPAERESDGDDYYEDY